MQPATWAGYAFAAAPASPAACAAECNWNYVGYANAATLHTQSEAELFMKNES